MESGGAMTARVFDLTAFRNARAERGPGRQIAEAAGFDLVPKVRPMTPAERGRLGGLAKPRHCAGCGETGHNWGRCPNRKDRG